MVISQIKKGAVMYITFAMKQTTYSRYSVDVPKELKHATDEELKKWLESGGAFGQNLEFIKTLDTIESQIDTDYEFEVTRR